MPSLLPRVVVLLAAGLLVASLLPKKDFDLERLTQLSIGAKFHGSKLNDLMMRLYQFAIPFALKFLTKLAPCSGNCDGRNLAGGR